MGVNTLTPNPHLSALPPKAPVPSVVPVANVNVLALPMRLLVLSAHNCIAAAVPVDKSHEPLYATEIPTMVAVAGIEKPKP